MARAMKDSGIKWIGEIPDRWVTIRLKNVAEIITGNTPSKSDDRYYAEDGMSWVKPNNLNGFYGFTETEEKLNNEGKVLARVVPEKTLLTCCIGSIGKFGYATEKVAFNQQINAIVFDSDQVFWKFGIYYMSVQDEQQKYYQNGNVVLILNTENQKQIILTLPSIPEQESIADFLNRKCSLIDCTIEKQKLVIEKLKVYKQSVITEAVTKGLDPTVKLKPSGIKWIGEIPEKWVVGPLKFFATIRSGITLGKKYSPGTELVEYPYLRVANVQGGYTDLTDVSTILITEEEAQKHKLQVGEVLMTEGGDRDKLGRGCIWYGEIENCLHQNHVFAVRTEESKIDAKFFDYITTSDVGRNYFDFTAKKTTNLASTNSTTILEFRFPVPHIDEQKEIISYLDTKCSQIDAIIIGKQKLIDKLTDYKKSLIYECVTGKREVI